MPKFNKEINSENFKQKKPLSCNSINKMSYSRNLYYKSNRENVKLLKGKQNKPKCKIKKWLNIKYKNKFKEKKMKDVDNIKMTRLDIINPN